MILNVKLVSLGTEWCLDRTRDIEEFWAPYISFNWEKVSAQLGAGEMMAWKEYQATLDVAVVNRWKDSDFDLTVLSAPYIINPKDYKGDPLLWRDSTGIKPRTSLFGLCLYSDNVLEVMTNEHDTLRSNNVDLGLAFERWFSHELNHHLNHKLGIEDNTHLHYYSGEPEKARDIILAKL